MLHSAPLGQRGSRLVWWSAVAHVSTREKMLGQLSNELLTFSCTHCPLLQITTACSNLTETETAEAELAMFRGDSWRFRTGIFSGIDSVFSCAMSSLLSIEMESFTLSASSSLSSNTCSCPPHQNCRKWSWLRIWHCVLSSERTSLVQFRMKDETQETNETF